MLFVCLFFHFLRLKKIL
uniref:Uncharacterized protein n=1 Tax=Arundo donax TaxID=35708 RepID=A0A0A9BCJ0_ARUDO